VVYLWFMFVAANLAHIQQRMATAAHRAGRQPEEIALMAVSKTFSPESIREAYAAGQRLFGESRVQEFAAKAEKLHDLPHIQCHMIGHLQGNKTAKAAELFAAIDSVDSLRLARRLNQSAQAQGKRLGVLIEINVGGEAAKSGIAAGSTELEQILLAAPEFEHLEIRGLMAVPPLAEDPQAARPYFRNLRELRERIAARRLPRVGMEVLSMGMSNDFEVAIAEGSTCVRVGTAIFGERPAR
jgi:PLP dependent protein